MLYSPEGDTSKLISKLTFPLHLPFPYRLLLLEDFDCTSLFHLVSLYFVAVHLGFFRTSGTACDDFLVVVILVRAYVLFYNLGTAAVVFGIRPHYPA